jgi:outer membrane autotransporter protein
MGATYRVDHQFSAYFGIGDIWGSVASAGASADINTAVATFGGRYGFSTLDAGPYVTARVTAGWADYQSKRAMGGGLGGAKGHSNGAVYSGRADLGDVVRLAPVTVTPQIGVRVANVSLAGFTESGSDLALAVSHINHASSSLLADMDVGLDPQRVNGWSLAPSVAFGYERALGNPHVDSSASLYGFAVSQSSAYASRNLMKVSVAVTARRDALTVKAGVNALRGDDSSSGLNAQLSIGYTF